jgi:hypothetical protein
VSRVVIPLARRTPPTALVPLHSTPQQGSRQPAMAAHATALTPSVVSVPCRAGTRVGHRNGWARPPTHVVPRHCGLGPEPRSSVGFRFFSFRFSKIPKKCLESLKIIENRV